MWQQPQVARRWRWRSSATAPSNVPTGRKTFLCRIPFRMAAFLPESSLWINRRRKHSVWQILYAQPRQPAECPPAVTQASQQVWTVGVDSDPSTRLVYSGSQGPLLESFPPTHETGRRSLPLQFWLKQSILLYCTPAHFHATCRWWWCGRLPALCSYCAACAWEEAERGVAAFVVMAASATLVWQLQQRMP